MATKLGDMAEGSIVKLKEEGSPAEFYVAEQDYANGLNGNGRVLVVRTDCVTKGNWSKSVNAYASSYVDSWLNETYKKRLDAEIQEAMGVTTFLYTPGNGNNNVTTLFRSVFLLSATELGQSAVGVNIEGSRLSIASILRSVETQFTRSPDTRTTDHVWRLYRDTLFDSNYCFATQGWRPAFTLPAALYVTDDGFVQVNTAPAAPAGISIPESIDGGTTITVSWTAASDAEGNLDGYILQRSTDGGSSWTQIYQGSALKTTNTVAFGTSSVMYRVKAYDTEGLESDWRTSAQRTVLNNRAPSAPGSITVPDTAKGGGVLTVSWTASTDSDGNLSGYALERQASGGSWTQIYKGSARTYTDSITRGWSTVAYRVRAYDTNGAYSGYTTGPARTVDNNYAPVIISVTASGTDLGTLSEAFDFPYTVTDADGDAATVREYLDDRLQRSYGAVLGIENAFQAVDPDHWQTVLNGVHTMKIAANDGKADSAPYSVSFTKAVYAASVTLAAPMEADAAISVCAVSVTGSIPADAVFKAEVTNNGLDDAPIWEDCTAEVRKGVNHIFENEAAAKGFAFNFRVTAERGASGQGGCITSIQGGFQ